MRSDSFETGGVDYRRPEPLLVATPGQAGRGVPGCSAFPVLRGSSAKEKARWGSKSAEEQGWTGSGSGSGQPAVTQPDHLRRSPAVLRFLLMDVTAVFTSSRVFHVLI